MNENPPKLECGELICLRCGNDKRFIEVMAEEAHLVNGRGDYIKLIEGIVDRHLCWVCGARIEAGSFVSK
jgi:hypothetical protein